MIPFIEAGGEALQQYTQELQEMGILSNETVAGLAGFDNVMNRIKTTFKQTGFELGASLLPVMEIFAGILEEKILPLIQRITKWF